MNYVFCADKIPAKLGGANLWNETQAGMLDVVSFPEIGKDFYGHPIGLQPDAVVEKVKGLVLGYVKTGRPFALLTASPFVLKALDVYSDLYECQEDFRWVGPDREETTFQELFRPMTEAFGKLTHGEHYAVGKDETGK